MLIGALSSASGKGRGPASASKPPTYEQAILAVPDVVAIWPFAETSGTSLIASFGGFDGAYSGAPTFGLDPLPAGSVRSTGFGGVASASVPHVSAFALAEFSFLIWFKATPPTEPDLGVIYSKDQSGLVAGDLSVFIDSSNVLSVQFQSGSSTFALPKRLVLDPDREYALVVRADGGGFDGYLTGRYLGENTSFTGAWAANTQPIRFAAAPGTSALGNVTLAYAALWSRVITEAEVLALSQNTALPVAANITASVPESATTNINVLGQSTWVGSNPAITVVLQPNGGDSVASSGAGIDKVAAYTAGAVSVNTPRSFQYRLTDPNGQSSSVGTVDVTVTNAPGAAANNANCYSFSETNVVTVTSMASLVTAVNNAPPGRQIKIAAGTYSEALTERTLDPSGTASNPIVVRPEGALGSVTINDARWTLATGSSSIVFTNLYFSNGRIAINGNGHRVTRCRFLSMSTTAVSCGSGTNWRVDHCDFSGWVSNTSNRGIIRINDNEVGAGSSHDYLIDYNYFHDIAPTTDANTQEFVGLQDASDAFDMTPGLVIDHNLFHNIGYFANGGEIIGAKTRGIVLRFNTFTNIGVGYINAPRIGAEFEVRSNWFENTQRTNFVMVRSNSPLVIGNRFVTGDLDISAGDYYFDPEVPLTPEVSALYAACSDARVIGNRMGLSGVIRVGAVNFTISGADVPARRTNLHLNTKDGGGTAHTLDPTWQTDTTANVDNEPFTAAVKIPVPTLTASDQVGMFAPDPLCPSGPQEPLAAQTTLDLPFHGQFYGAATNGMSVANSTLNSSVQTFFWAERTGVISQFRCQVRVGPGYSSGDGGIYTVSIYPADASTRRRVANSAAVSQRTGWAPGPGAGSGSFPIVSFTQTGQVVAKRPYVLFFQNTHSNPGGNYISLNQPWLFAAESPPATGPTGVDPRAVGATPVAVSGWSPVWIDGTKERYPYPTVTKANSYRNIGEALVGVKYNDGIWAGLETFSSEQQLTDGYKFVITGSAEGRVRFRVSRATRRVNGLFMRTSRMNTSTGSIRVRLESGPASDTSGNGTVMEDVSVPMSIMTNVGANETTSEASNDSGNQKINWIWVPFTATRTLTLGQLYSLRLTAVGSAQALIWCTVSAENYYAGGVHPVNSTWAQWEAGRNVDWTGWEDSRGFQTSTNGGSTWAWSSKRRRTPLVFRCVTT